MLKKIRVKLLENKIRRRLTRSINVPRLGKLRKYPIIYEELNYYDSESLERKYGRTASYFLKLYKLTESKSHLHDAIYWGRQRQCLNVSMKNLFRG